MIALRNMRMPDKSERIERPKGLPRRDFVLRSAVLGTCAALSRFAWGQGASGVHFSVADYDRSRIIAAANRALVEAPVSITDVHAPGKRNVHIFYSETSALAADAGPATKDDLPAAKIAPFFSHLDLLVQMNARVSALTAAWRLTREQRYRDAALAGLRTWCLDPAKQMLPSLEDAGIVSGNEDDERNNGICETACLVETARAAAWLCSDPEISREETAAIRQWFADLLTWFMDSKKGSIAREAKDLQAICWTMQAAEFARFTRNDTVLRVCSHQFRDRLLRQINFDGNFAAALHTDRPYASSLFTLECLATACETLSTPFESLWSYNLPDGRGMRSAVAWAFPFIQNRAKWPYVADAHHFGDEPIRQNSLLFAGRAYDRPEYIELWKAMTPDSSVVELQREQPVTQPALWALRPPT